MPFQKKLSIVIVEELLKLRNLTTTNQYREPSIYARTSLEGKNRFAGSRKCSASSRNKGVGICFPAILLGGRSDTEQSSF
jgi:hypothetical protein